MQPPYFMKQSIAAELVGGGSEFLDANMYTLGLAECEAEADNLFDKK